MKALIQIVCFVFFVCAAPLYAGESPTEDLKPTLSSLVTLLGDESLKGDEMKVERRAKIMEEVKKGFDFREMSRRVLGKTWREIDEAERDNFTVLMTKLLENVYVGKLENYSGGAIEYVGEKVKGTLAQVTTIVEDGGVKLPVHYIMRKKETVWMVYDINIEGVSLVRNYQQQFKSILRKDKYEGLVETLIDKNKDFAEGQQ